MKVFGGAKVIASSNPIGKHNAEFVLEFIKAEGLTLVGQDMGGMLARRVHYFPAPAGRCAGCCARRRCPIRSRAKCNSCRICGPSRSKAISNCLGIDDGQSIRVAIVDDSALMRRMLTEALSAEPGFEVVGHAADPFEAREMIKATNPMS